MEEEDLLRRREEFCFIPKGRYRFNDMIVDIEFAMAHFWRTNQLRISLAGIWFKNGYQRVSDCGSQEQLSLFVHG